LNDMAMSFSESETKEIIAKIMADIKKKVGE
jgi:hypothetical protein